VAQAVAIANAIRVNRDAAECILEQHGMTEEQFDMLILEIAEDGELSPASAVAMKD